MVARWLLRVSVVLLICSAMARPQSPHPDTANDLSPSDQIGNNPNSDAATVWLPAGYSAYLWSCSSALRWQGHRVRTLTPQTISHLPIRSETTRTLMPQLYGCPLATPRICGLAHLLCDGKATESAP